jgi:hypothetical protein
MSSGATSANRAPVHLSRQRGRPPACHRRGRCPSIFQRATAPMVRRSGASEPEATQNAVAPGRRGSVCRQGQRSAIANSARNQRQLTGSANSVCDQRHPRPNAKWPPTLPPGPLSMDASEWFNETDSRSGAPSPCHLERSGLRGRAVERSPDGTRRYLARGAPPDLWGPFDSFADSLAQGDM